jgi:hypothetical protein
MIVTLDLTRLLNDRKITKEEHDRLLALGTVATGYLAFNILIAFGVIGVSAGIILLVPNPIAGIIVGAVLLAGGLLVYANDLKQWEVLANITVLVGALVLAGGGVVLFNASAMVFLAIAAGFAVIGVLSGSGLLVSLSILALSSTVGARSYYEDATYLLGIEEPTVTVLLFSVVALATFLISKALPPVHERLAIIASRTSIFLVNLGFWIGSLWGDAVETADLVIPELAFSVGWAAGLVGLGIWAAVRGRRWVVNVVAIFGAIHFYTQWFEHLGAQPGSVLGGGIAGLLIAFALRQFNRRANVVGGEPAGEGLQAEP